MFKWLTEMSTDWLMWAALVIQLLLVLLGAIIALQEDWERRYRWPVLSAFLILGVAGMLVSAKQGTQATADATKLSHALSDLGDSTRETARITSLNTQLQQRLLAQSDALTILAKQNIASVTGGDSYCWILLVSQPDAAHTVQLAAAQGGKYPVRGVHARMVDLLKFDKIVANSPVSMQNFFVADTNYEVGDLAVHAGKQLGSYRFVDDGEAQYFNIFFNGLNGFWTELLRLKRVNGTWYQAVKVVREMPGQPQRTLFVQVDKVYPGYPNNVDWKDPIDKRAKAAQHH